MLTEELVKRPGPPMAREPLRITYLLEDTALWGGVKVVLEQVNRLVGRGHIVHVVSKSGQPDWFNLRIPVIGVDRFTGKNVPASDVIVGTYWTTVRSANDIRRGIPVHFCQGYEGWYPNMQDLMVQRLIEATYGLNTTFKIAITPFLKTFIEKTYGQACHVVPNAIDSEVFYPRPETPQRHGSQRVLAVGPFSVSWKGIPCVIDAMARAKRKNPHLSLVRVSQFPIEPAEAAAGVVDEYYYRLRPEQLAVLYRSADIFVGSSVGREEGFFLPAVEAMASGVPCVLTDIPAHRGYSEALDYAAFVPPSTPSAMAEAILELAEDENRRRALASRGMDVASCFTWDRSLDALETALGSITSGGSSAYELFAERSVPGWTDEPTLEFHRLLYQVAGAHVRGRTVLDMGCGVGYGTQMLADRFGARAVSGVDVSIAAVEYAKRHYSSPCTSFDTMDVRRLAFAEGSFEVVVALEVFEHMEEPAVLLREAWRVLKPGGRLIVSTPNKLLYSPQGDPVCSFHRREWTLDEFSSEIRRVFRWFQVSGVGMDGRVNELAQREHGHVFIATAFKPVHSPHPGRAEDGRTTASH